MKVFFLAVILSFLLFSCRSREDIAGTETNYFNMDSLIENQVAQLIKLNPQLSKEATLDQNTEQVKLRLDSLGWEKELQVFRDSNIDKPAFYGYYKLNKANQDPFSNLLYDEYTINGQEKIPVKNLRIYYLDEPQAVKRIEIIIKDKNELFESERMLKMTFDERVGLPVLSSYNVDGRQKLKLNNQVNYAMKGILIF